MMTTKFWTITIFDFVQILKRILDHELQVEKKLTCFAECYILSTQKTTHMEQAYSSYFYEITEYIKISEYGHSLVKAQNFLE